MNELRILREELDEVFADPEFTDRPHAEQLSIVCSLICDAFAVSGLKATVVGGGAIEFHAPGAYTTHDADFVVEAAKELPDRQVLRDVFDALGFTKHPGRHWVRDDFFVEVPSFDLGGPAEEHAIGPHTLRVIKKEVVLVERVVEFDQTGHTGYGAQAITMLRAFGDELDLELLDQLLRRERASRMFRLLERLADTDREITAELLREERRGLQNS